jgi:hypothetical protein
MIARKSCMTCKWSGWIHPPGKCMSCGPFGAWEPKSHRDYVVPEEVTDVRQKRSDHSASTND